MPRPRWAALRAVAIGCCAFVYLTQAASAASATVDARVLETAVPSASEGARCMVRVDASLAAAGLDCEGDWVAFDCPAEGTGALVGDRMLASSRLALVAGKRVELLVADGEADGVCRTERIKVQDGADEEADDDGDGVANLADDLPLDPLSAADLDGDGQGDETDPDDDGDGIPDADDPAPRHRNRAPVVVGSLPDRTVFHHGGTGLATCFGRMLWPGTLQALFSDPDGDALTLALESDAPSVASARLSYLSDDEGDFHAFCIWGEAAGATTFALMATDPAGLSASLSFQVIVKPRVGTYRDYTNRVGYHDVSLGARCGTKICGNEGEGELGVIKEYANSQFAADRFCQVIDRTRWTHRPWLGFDYLYSEEGSGQVQVCPRRGGKEHGLFTYRSGAGKRNRFGDDPNVYCGVTTTVSASEVIDGYRLRDLYASEAKSERLLEMLQLPAGTAVSFSCDGFPNTVPVVSRRIPTQYLTAGNAVTVDLDGVFEAAEWMPLAIYTEVRDESIASVELAGTTLRIRPLADGETEVLLNAVNEYGATVGAFPISVGEFVDIFWYLKGGKYGWWKVPPRTECGDIACGRVDGHGYVEPSPGPPDCNVDEGGLCQIRPRSDEHCPRYSALQPEWGSARFRYESSADAETGERIFEVCPLPGGEDCWSGSKYPKNTPGRKTFLVDRRGVSVSCYDSDLESSQIRFLFGDGGFALSKGEDGVARIGFRTGGPLPYSAALPFHAQVGVEYDDVVLAPHLCRCR